MDLFGVWLAWLTECMHHVKRLWVRFPLSSHLLQVFVSQTKDKETTNRAAKANAILLLRSSSVLCSAPYWGQGKWKTATNLNKIIETESVRKLEFFLGKYCFVHLCTSSDFIFKHLSNTKQSFQQNFHNSCQCDLIKLLNGKIRFLSSSLIRISQAEITELLPRIIWSICSFIPLVHTMLTKCKHFLSISKYNKLIQ